MEVLTDWNSWNSATTLQSLRTPFPLSPPHLLLCKHNRSKDGYVPFYREDGHKVDMSVGYKAEGKSTASPSRIVCRYWLSLLCIHLCVQMWMATFVEEDSASIVPLYGSPRGRQEDRVGIPSESSHIATWPLKRTLLFQILVPGKQLKLHPLSYDN